MDKNRFTGTGKGITMARVMEITEAQRRGQEISLTPEEEAELKVAQASLKKMSAGIEPALETQRGVERAQQAVTSLRSQLLPENFEGPTVPDRIPNPKLERDLRNSQNIEAATKVLEEVVGALKEQNDAADRRDEEAARLNTEAKEAQKKNHRVAVYGVIFAALAVVVPIIIEVIKGWA